MGILFMIIIYYIMCIFIKKPHTSASSRHIDPEFYRKYH